jgi:hypothetical protein
MDLPDLNLSLGSGVQAAIRDRFGEPVNFFPISDLKQLFLVASFRNCKFKLSEFSVGRILQATPGGVVADFRPQQLSERVFNFVVA